MAVLESYDPLCSHEVTDDFVYGRQWVPLGAPCQRRVEEIAVDSVVPHQLEMPIVRASRLIWCENWHDLVKSLSLKSKLNID